MKVLRIDKGLISVFLAASLTNLLFLQHGRTNPYYAIAVKSMMKNFHNFFFAAYDPSGFISVDKPPVALWLQVLSSKLFGYSTLSLLLPEALASIIACCMLYLFVCRHANRTAATLAGMALALTPIYVAVSRTNNMDSILVCTLMLAADTLFKAVKTGKLRWLMLCALLTGLGYNIKMLEVAILLPAIYVFFFLSSSKRSVQKLAQLALFTLVMLAVASSWSLAVSAVPASERPFVGSSANNSEFNLAFGYNGISRVISAHRPSVPIQRVSIVKKSNPEIGNPGLLRLFSTPLNSQIGWFLMPAVAGILLLIGQAAQSKRMTRVNKYTVFWAVWLITGILLFSFASFFHAYYLATLAPPAAALTGICLSHLLNGFYQPRGQYLFLFPLMLGASLLFDTVILQKRAMGTATTAWLGAVAALMFAIGLLLQKNVNHQLKMVYAHAGFAMLFLMPLLWLLPNMTNLSSGTDPVAGPPASFYSQLGNEKILNGNLAWRKLEFALKHSQSAFYSVPHSPLLRFIKTKSADNSCILAVDKAPLSFPVMQYSSLDVLTIGGYTGNDRILTLNSLKQIIQQKSIRYFLLENNDVHSPNAPLFNWIRAHSFKVPRRLWAGSSLIPMSKPNGLETESLYLYHG
ncbi:MAG: glycosyltransferase family 39 protein [Sporolactobacillus sp.]